MTFILLRCIMVLQSLACLKVLLKRSVLKWSEWILFNRAFTLASILSRENEDIVSADLRTESREEVVDALGN